MLKVWKETFQVEQAMWPLLQPLHLLLHYESSQGQHAEERVWLGFNTPWKGSGWTRSLISVKTVWESEDLLVLKSSTLPLSPTAPSNLFLQFSSPMGCLGRPGTSFNPFSKNQIKRSERIESSCVMLDVFPPCGGRVERTQQGPLSLQISGEQLQDGERPHLSLGWWWQTCDTS